MLGNKSAAALNPKIVNDEIIFVRGNIAIKPRAKFVNILCRGVAIKSPHRGIKATKAQHILNPKIAYGGGNFVRC